MSVNPPAELSEDRMAWYRQKSDNRVALDTLPRTRWIPLTAYDKQGNPPTFPSILAALQDTAHRAREKTLSALLQWATTGKWPAVRTAPAFFLRVMLHSALPEPSTASPPDTSLAPTRAQPWSTDEAARLASRVVLDWYLWKLNQWAEDRARQELSDPYQ